MEKISKWLTDRENEIISTLKAIVELESPSRNKKLTDKLCDYLEELFTSVAKVKRVYQRHVGDNLKITFGKGRKKILILCHMDTVFDEGEIKNSPFQIKNNKIYGPGIYDMKYSIAQIFYLLKAFKEFNIDLGYRIVLYINSDEEIGSHYSKRHYLKEVNNSVCGLVLETSYSGCITTRRKGSSGYKLKVYGRAAHAGGSHALGISAIKEMAYQVLDIESINDWDGPSTINVGTIKGGQKHNIVPDFCEICVDARYCTIEQGLKIDKKMKELTPKLEGTRLEVTGGMGRPPMEQFDSSKALYELIKKSGEQLNIDLKEYYAGGVSDANYISAAGLPTVDGMGGMGFGAHTKNEYIYKDSIVSRIVLLGQILINLSKCKLDYINWEEYCNDGKEF